MNAESIKTLGYAFPVTSDLLEQLNYRELLNTHDFILKHTIKQDFKNESLNNQYKWCRKEIEERLMKYRIKNIFYPVESTN